MLYKGQMGVSGLEGCGAVPCGSTMHDDGNGFHGFSEPCRTKQT